MTSTAKSKDEAGSLALLQQIRNGDIQPKSLAPLQRRLLVSRLLNEGQSSSEIAQLLDVSDRTIERDRQALRKEGSLQHDPDLVNEVAGQLKAQGELSTQRMLKIARGKDAPCSVKVDAYHRCFEIFCRYIEKLQSLGFLPTAATKVEAKLSRGFDEIPSIDEIDAELLRIDSLLPDGTKNKARIRSLIADTKKVKLASKVKQIEKDLELKGDQNDKAD